MTTDPKLFKPCIRVNMAQSRERTWISVGAMPTAYDSESERTGFEYDVERR